MSEGENFRSGDAVNNESRQGRRKVTRRSFADRRAYLETLARQRLLLGRVLTVCGEPIAKEADLQCDRSRGHVAAAEDRDSCMAGGRVAQRVVLRPGRSRRDAQTVEREAGWLRAGSRAPE